jgi:hypothetical protein
MTQAQGKEMAKMFVPKGFTILCLACSRNFISTIKNLIQTPLFHIPLSKCFPILSECPRATIQLIKKDKEVKFFILKILPLCMQILEAIRVQSNT